MMDSRLRNIESVYARKDWFGVSGCFKASVALLEAYYAPHSTLSYAWYNQRVDRIQAGGYSVVWTSRWVIEQYLERWLRDEQPFA